MTLKAPLKISAVGLSLLAIAVSSCNKGATNTSSDTNNNTPAPLDPKDNQPASNRIKRLSVKVGQEKIPAGTCTSYEVSATDEADQTVNITGNKFLSVSLNETSEIKQFSLDEAKHLICAHNKTEKDEDQILASEGSKATLVASTLTNTATAEVEAVAPINLVAVKVAYPSDSSNRLNVAVGTKTAQFQIKTKQSFNSTAEAIQSAEGFELFDNANNKVELKSETAGQFYFEIPKTAKVGNIQYTLRSTTQPSINTPIDIQVTAAVLTSVELAELSTGTLLPEVLNSGNAITLNINGVLSNGNKIDLSAKNSGYTLNVSEAAATINPQRQLVLTVPAATTEKFLPQSLTFNITKRDESSPTNYGKQAKYYIDYKPMLNSADLKFTKKVDNKNEFTDTIAVGGSLETTVAQRDLRCAKLAEATFEVGDRVLSATLSNLIITVPEKSNFVVVNNSYVCATEKALPNEKVTVTIASKDDPSVNAVKEFTASPVYRTNRITLVNEVNAKVANYSIALSEANQNRNLNFKYLNSDNSVSDNIVPADNIEVAFNPESTFFSTTKADNLGGKTWQVSITEGQLETLKKQTIVSQKIAVKSTDNNFSIEIPVTFSK